VAKCPVLRMGGVARTIGVISVGLGVIALAVRNRSGASLLVGGAMLLLLGPLTAFLLSAFS